jgi:hypothetical protein
MKNDVARLGANYSTSASGSAKHYYRTSWQTNAGGPTIFYAANPSKYSASSELGTYSNVYNSFMHMASPGFFNKNDYLINSTISKLPGVSTYSNVPVASNQMRMSYLNDARVKHYVGGSVTQEVNSHYPYRGYDAGFVRVVDVPPGVKELSFMLVGAGGGGTLSDVAEGAVGGAGNFVTGKLDISASATRWRRYVMVAGTPGFSGLGGTWVEGGMGGNSGEIFPVDDIILNYPEANSMAPYSTFLKTYAVSYKRRENPYMTRPVIVNANHWDSNILSTTENGMVKDIITNGLSQFNHRFVFYVPYTADAELTGYTISYEADDIMKFQLFDPITGSSTGMLGTANLHSTVIDQSLDFSVLPSTKHSSGGDGKYMLIGLNVFVENANSPYPSFNPCMFAIVIKNASGTIVWTTRDNYPQGIGAISAVGKGAAGGTSGFFGTSASGGGGGGASYIMEIEDIESTNVASVKFSVIALAGGGGGAGGAGGDGGYYHPGNESLRGLSQDFSTSIGNGTTAFRRATEGFSVNTFGFFTDDVYGNSVPNGPDNGGGAGGGGGGAGLGGAIGGFGNTAGAAGTNGFDYVMLGCTQLASLAMSTQNPGLAYGVPGYSIPTTTIRYNWYFPSTTTLIFPGTGTDVTGTYTQNNMGMGGYSQVGAQLSSPGKPGFCYLEWGAPN